MHGVMSTRTRSLSNSSLHDDTQEHHTLLNRDPPEGHHVEQPAATKAGPSWSAVVCSATFAALIVVLLIVATKYNFAILTTSLSLFPRPPTLSADAAGCAPSAAMQQPPPPPPPSPPPPAQQCPPVVAVQQPQQSTGKLIEYRARLSHVPRANICDARHWDSFVSVLLDMEASVRDDSGMDVARAEPLVDSSTHRLYRALLKALCGHPVEIGVMGTSVSAGRHHENDVSLVWAHTVWQWLQWQPSLPQARSGSVNELKHGYRNVAVAAQGSDLASTCLGQFWAKTTGIRNKVIDLGTDRNPDPYGLTASQLAAQLGREVVLPDILFLEFTANDWGFVTHQSSPDVVDVDTANSSALVHPSQAALCDSSWDGDDGAAAPAAAAEAAGADGECGQASSSHDQQFGNATRNMEALVAGAVSHRATATVLVNTVLAYPEKLQPVISLYKAVSDKWQLPTVDYYDRWMSAVPAGTDDAVLHGYYQLILDKWHLDYVHLNQLGHDDLGMYVINDLLQPIVLRIRSGNRRAAE